MKFIQAIVTMGVPALAGARLLQGDRLFADKKRYESRSPTTSRPSSSPTDSCDLTCQVDEDCPRICVGSTSGGYNKPPTPGTCAPASTEKPTRRPTSPPIIGCPCDNPSNIPDVCEVEILIDMMETFVMGQHELIAQWTRAAFHDAGTFNQNTTAPHGGANGCLMNFPPMRLEPENNFLDAPLNTLEAIKDAWHADPRTCIKVSSADMLQFAIFFATNRQKFFPESLLTGTTTALAKRLTLTSQSLWGREDELDCDTLWVDNLPGFVTPMTGGSIPGRCTGASDEIVDKMMVRNGFTAEEATVLIGAHTIGLIRNTFGPGLAGPWVDNGADNATPDGPVFDNLYHDFLINDIVENTCTDFASNVFPFTMTFPDWFRDGPNDLDHLDTDIALAFPPEPGATHPNFMAHSIAFAFDNTVFLSKFFAALKKMSHLGVTVDLRAPKPCEKPCGGDGSGGGDGGDGDKGAPRISVNTALSLIKELGNATAFADMAISKTQEGRIEELKKITTPVRNQPPSFADPTGTEATKLTSTEATKSRDADKSNPRL